MNGLIAAVEGSPACGHAGGHYGKAVRDLYATEAQLRIGCREWAKDVNPKCGIATIDRAIADAEREISASPASGHAGGHYAKAIRDLEATKRQLHDGCAAWQKDGAKPNSCSKVQRPEMIPAADPACRIDAIEAAMNGIIGAVEGSPACGHAGGHYGKADHDLYATEAQLRIGCREWAKDRKR
jgi:hypothetical protein